MHGHKAKTKHHSAKHLGMKILHSVKLTLKL